MPWRCWISPGTERTRPRGFSGVNHWKRFGFSPQSYCLRNGDLDGGVEFTTPSVILDGSRSANGMPPTASSSHPALTEREQGCRDCEDRRMVPSSRT